MLIVPDRHGTGTNALLLTPPDAWRPLSVPGAVSVTRRVRESEGTTPEVVDVPSLALDVDTPEDLDALREGLDRTHGGAAHTRGMLRQLHAKPRFDATARRAGRAAGGRCPATTSRRLIAGRTAP